MTTLTGWERKIGTLGLNKGQVELTLEEHLPQKTWPHALQWCCRVKVEKATRHLGRANIFIIIAILPIMKFQLWISTLIVNNYL